MLTKLKFAKFITILLFCYNSVKSSSIDTIQGVETLRWFPKRAVIVDRLMAEHPSPGYFVLPVDRTAFSINYPVWLYQFDISKVYVSNNGSLVPVDYVPVKVKIVEKYLSDMHDKDVVFVGQATLNSTNEVHIRLSSEILLNPKSMYEIRLAMPSYNFMYNECFNIKEQRVKRHLWRSLILTYYQNNIVNPPFNVDSGEQEVSRGMVKRLYLKYSKF